MPHLHVDANQYLKSLTGLEASPQSTPLASTSQSCAVLLENDTKPRLGRPVGLETTPDTAQTVPEGELFNDRPPLVVIKTEKPEHRLVILLKAQGYSNLEIAEKIGYTPVMVSQILRQPWARKRLLEEMNASGRTEIAKILAASAADSVFTLIELRDSEDAKPTDRIRAATTLLEHFIGRPTEHVEHSVSTAPPIAALADIDAELAAIAKEEQELKGN